MQQDLSADDQALCSKPELGMWRFLWTVTRMGLGRQSVARDWESAGCKSMGRSPHSIALYSNYSEARRWIPDGEPLNAQQITMQTARIGNGEMGHERLTEPNA